MSAAREAWSFRGGVVADPLYRKAHAFTLVELLAVVAIIAIMSALLTPAVRGLLGVTGPRGGVNALSAALEQARLSAMESGVPSYVGWVQPSADAEASALIVFRDKKEGETAAIIPVTRWIKLPQGVFFDAQGTTVGISAGSDLPKLNGKPPGNLTAVKFDRFGRLSQAAQPVVLRVGAKTKADSSFIGGANQHFEISVQPLTGRAVVVDKAMGD